MPQIAQIGEIYSSQLFWLTIVFGLVFLTVGLGMLPKVQSTVDARDARIAADLERAEKARAAADQLEDEYREAMDRARGESGRAVAEAKAHAARVTEQRLQEASSGIDAQLGESQRRIAVSRDAAIRELQVVAAEAAQQIVARVANLQVDDEAAAEAVRKESIHG